MGTSKAASLLSLSLETEIDGAARLGSLALVESESIESCRFVWLSLVCLFDLFFFV